MRRHAWTAAFCTAALIGCGGGGGDGGSMGSCPPFTACGGDIEGTWDLEQMCLDADVAELAGIDEPECANAFENVRYRPDATLEATADTIELLGTLTYAMDIVLTDACVQALSGSSTARADRVFCAEFERSLNEPDPSSPFQSVTCTAMAGTCRCTALSKPSDISQAGSYRIEGNAFVDPSGEDSPYCVQDDTLTVESRSMALGFGGQMVLRRR